VYIAFEESAQQIIRNAATIGIDLKKHLKNGLLRFEATRSSSQGLEMHLATFFKIVNEFEPAVVVVDPITNLITTGNSREVRAMLGRMMDMFKTKNITALFTSLTQGGGALEQTEYGVSSFVDTWMLLRDFEQNGERNRLIYVLKSRGTAHSNQVREFIISAKGIKLVDVYMGNEGILTGSARLNAETNAKAVEQSYLSKLSKQKKYLEHKRLITKARLKSEEAELAMNEAELESLVKDEAQRREIIALDNSAMKSSRSGIKQNEGTK
jgi:circadian clock protein KaiC